MTSWNQKSRVLEKKTAEQLEKWIVGSWNRKSRVLERKTAGEFENRIGGARWGKTTEKTRAQSPKSNFWNVGDPLSQRKRRVDVVKNSFNGRHVFNKSWNEDPRLLVIIQIKSHQSHIQVCRVCQW